MANQSSVIQIAIGLSKSLVNEANKLGFVGTHDSLKPKNMDSTRILGSESINPNQDHKKLVVRREQMLTQQHVEVIDDTALIETTAAVTGFKNRYGRHPVNTLVLRNPKQEFRGKKKGNKGVKKLEARCSMKCLNEKKLISQGVRDNNTTEKKISDGKGQKVYRKMAAKVKYGYQRKDIKIFGGTMQETDVNLKVSGGSEKVLTTKLVETEAETETVDKKDDGLKLNTIVAVQNVYENTTVGSKKVAYSREELEAVRSVDEEGQKSKWVKVYSGFAPSVAREYTGLVNRLTQRYTRVINCGSTRGASAMLNVPPVLPLCSPSNYI